MRRCLDNFCESQIVDEDTKQRLMADIRHGLKSADLVIGCQYLKFHEG